MEKLKNILVGVVALIVIVGISLGKMSKYVKPTAKAIKEVTKASEGVTKANQNTFYLPIEIKELYKKICKNETQDSLNITKSGVSIDDLFY